MLNITRTNSDNPDFIRLVRLLDQYLQEIDGPEHAFYAQFNTISKIQHAIVGYEDGQPVACGAIKEYDSTTMEVKRMFVLPEYRGKGFASDILKELESWVKELSYSKCILETGIRQTAAVELYKKSGYKIIPSYGQYENVENSVCFEKDLKK